MKVAFTAGVLTLFLGGTIGGFDSVRAEDSQYQDESQSFSQDAIAGEPVKGDCCNNQDRKFQSKTDQGGCTYLECRIDLQSDCSSRKEWQEATLHSKDICSRYFPDEY